MIAARLAGIDERAAAGRDDEVPGLELVGEHGAFERPEVRLAVAREDVGDGHVLALLDQLVDVDGAQSSRLASARASVVLPAAMKPTR